MSEERALPHSWPLRESFKKWWIMWGGPEGWIRVRGGARRWIKKATNVITPTWPIVEIKLKKKNNDKKT